MCGGDGMGWGWGLLPGQGGRGLRCGVQARTLFRVLVVSYVNKSKVKG